jgi:hypothetical protein
VSAIWRAGGRENAISARKKYGPKFGVIAERYGELAGNIQACAGLLALSGILLFGSGVNLLSLTLVLMLIAIYTLITQELFTQVRTLPFGPETCLRSLKRIESLETDAVRRRFNFSFCGMAGIVSMAGLVSLLMVSGYTPQVVTPPPSINCVVPTGWKPLGVKLSDGQTFTVLYHKVNPDELGWRLCDEYQIIDEALASEKYGKEIGEGFTGFYVGMGKNISIGGRERFSATPYGRTKDNRNDASVLQKLFNDHPNYNSIMNPDYAVVDALYEIYNQIVVSGTSDTSNK